MVFITVILPIGVRNLLFQQLSTFFALFIALLKFSSGIFSRCTEKSIPKNENSVSPQCSFAEIFSFSLQCFLLPIHIILVFFGVHFET